MLEDLAKSLYSKPNSEATPVVVDKEVFAYCLLGDHDFLDDQHRPRINISSTKTLAKSIVSSGSTKYFIKTGKYNKIYNPIGMYSEGTNNKFQAKIGRNEWEFKEVNQKIFDLYLKFLTSKNIAWLNNAERELS